MKISIYEFFKFQKTCNNAIQTRFWKNNTSSIPFDVKSFIF